MEQFDLEHPDITEALRTGYPIQKKPVAVCTCCGQAVDPYDIDYSKLAVQGNDCFCKDCLEEELKQLSVWEIAKAVGFDVIDYRR